MREAVDVAVLAPDPWFGGGGRRQTEAFWQGAVALGRRPHLLFVSRERALSPGRRSLELRMRPAASAPLAGTAVPSFLPELDALSLAVGAERLAEPARRAASVWVVAPTAHFGAAAVRARRPYGCWVGTVLEQEWAARRRGLARSRRLALAVNAPVLRRLERAVVRRARVLLATSPSAREAVAAVAGLPPDRVGLLPIPVDVDRLRPEPDGAWEARLAEPVVVFAGRADDPRKNVGLLLQAFRELRRALPAARLRLVGAPPPPRVRLPEGAEALGHVPDVAGALRTAAVLVLPSLQEGFGVVAAEALACGVPVVSTPCGGPEHLLRASGGGVVLPGFGAHELAATLAGLLGDPDRLRALRRAGRAHVEREHSPARFRELLAPAFAALDDA